MQGIDDMCQWFRHLPLTDFPFFQEAAPYFYDWVAHPDDDDYWAQWNIEAHYHAVRFRPAILVDRRHLPGRDYPQLSWHARTWCDPEARQGQAHHWSLATRMAAE